MAQNDTGKGDAAANKAVMRRFYEEFWCNGNEAAVDTLVSKDVVDHQRPEGWPAGRDGIKQLVRVWREGFPDMRETIEDLIAEGDRVVGRFTIEATHTGHFLDIPPTGRRIRIAGIDIVRICDGQITDFWYAEDALGLYRQLGVEAPAAMPGVRNAGAPG
jgi:predicted ester cyclase